MEFIEEWSETTGIGWWDENRKKLNEAIRWYNEFIEKKNRTSEAVLAKVDQIRRYGNNNGFSRDQREELDNIEYRMKRFKENDR